MNEIPDRAQVAIIGAGIVGNSLAYHLADLGMEGRSVAGQRPSTYTQAGPPGTHPTSSSRL